MSEDLQVAPNVTIPSRELEWKATRAAGPGGQNVNKVSSKVELRFLLSVTSAIEPKTRARLRALARHRLDAEGNLLLTSQKTRDQHRNLEDAREKLKLLVLEAMIVPKARRETRPTRGSVKRRLESKSKRSETKRARSYRSDD